MGVRLSAFLAPLQKQRKKTASGPFAPRFLISHFQSTCSCLYTLCFLGPLSVFLAPWVPTPAVDILLFLDSLLVGVHLCFLALLGCLHLSFPGFCSGVGVCVCVGGWVCSPSCLPVSLAGGGLPAGRGGTESARLERRLRAEAC